MRNETDAWKVINKYRYKKRSDISSEISISNWKEYFMDLLVGEERKPTLTRKRNQEGDTEVEFEKEKIERHIRGIKARKAARADGISGEA